MTAATARQFGVFVAVGVVCAVVDVGLLWLLTRGGMAAVPAATAGFFAGLLLNFVLHLRVTFAAPWSLRAGWRYLAVVAVNYGITVACVGVSASLLGSPLPGKILSLPVIAVNGFLLSKHWVFR
jgi:putative flippase GtrA